MGKEGEIASKDLSRREFMTIGPAGALGAADWFSDIRNILRTALSFRQPLSATVSLPKIYLSAINWINQYPAGVRLRWMFPLRTKVGDNYLGFPELVNIQRAILPEISPLDPGTVNVGSAPTVLYPRQWWKRGLQMRSIAPARFLPPSGHSSVQAITFLYKGPDSRCCVLDSNRCVLGDFPIQNGGRMYFEGGDIAEVEFLSDDATKIALSDDWFLDLYEPRNLDWQNVATIAVQAPLLSETIGDFQAIKSRMYGHPTLSQADWKSIQNHAAAADVIKKPADDDPHLNSPVWDVWLAIQSFLWEITVLSGYGFVHGPQRPVTVQGDAVSTWLPGPLAKYTAYRIVVPHPVDPLVATSNIVVVSPNSALPLKPPVDLDFQSPVVKLEQRVDDFDPSKPSSVRSVYWATGMLAWAHKQDPWAMGIDVTETILPSPTVQKPKNPVGLKERIHARKRRLVDLVGSNHRHFELAFPDCPLQISATTFDGWDRRSTPAPIVDGLFELQHHPIPPNLACAVYDPAPPPKVVLDRLVGNPKCLDSSVSYKDWAPDEIVKKRFGTVEIVRRVRFPLSLPVKIISVSIVEPDIFVIQLADALDPGQFESGQLISKDQIGMILEVSADRKSLRVSSSDALLNQQPLNNEIRDPKCASFDHASPPVISFTPGPAQIVEDRHAPSLWTQVFSTSTIETLDPQLTVPENTKLPEEGTDSLVYASRVGFTDFHGRRTYGPCSNAVSVLRKSVPPSPPPPFTIQPLGWDYFRRLVVSLALNPTPPVRENALFTIAWAPGRKLDWLESTHATTLIPTPPNAPKPRSFASAGLTGRIGQQRAYQGRIYEVLEIPEPHFSDVYVTIGVKGVDRIGQESAYTLGELLILAS
jgi:hypothetical protein